MKAEELREEIVESYGQGSDRGGWNAWDDRVDLRDRLNEYANQRVIEELESLVDGLDGCWNRDVLRRRIKELKQDKSEEK